MKAQKQAIDFKSAGSGIQPGSWFRGERTEKQSKVFFSDRSTGSIHRKGREERKAQQQKPFYLEEIIRPGTRITRARRAKLVVASWCKSSMMKG